MYTIESAAETLLHYYKKFSGKVFTSPGNPQGFQAAERLLKFIGFDNPEWLLEPTLAPIQIPNVSHAQMLAAEFNELDHMETAGWMIFQAAENLLGSAPTPKIDLEKETTEAAKELQLLVEKVMKREGCDFNRAISFILANRLM